MNKLHIFAIIAAAIVILAGTFAYLSLSQSKYSPPIIASAPTFQVNNKTNQICPCMSAQQLASIFGAQVAQNAINIRYLPSLGAIDEYSSSSRFVLLGAPLSQYNVTAGWVITYMGGNYSGIMAESVLKTQNAAQLYSYYLQNSNQSTAQTASGDSNGFNYTSWGNSTSEVVLVGYKGGYLAHLVVSKATKGGVNSANGIAGLMGQSMS